MVLFLPNAPPEVTSGATTIYSIVDDGALPHTWHECRADNNSSPKVSGKCDGPK